ncbi:ArnT family glycosyltransferase [Robertkochia solimangrovi]|uniref:ArnT family glycosyltransferase n=1 Tax=Robertkochia solimangrovi TaxID=2213046 RepID=UPI00117CEAB7|nr:glycosyltransferase family 39 protein [Robertkochia solimangrovi]TRZ42803.1 hypothetical protein DMZ48_12090 [Robertkochia solimangrovi]
MIEYIEKNPVKIVLLVCLLIFCVNLDVLYVNIMEARNFVTAREMIDQGHWILTTMNEFPRYEKPPLPTWLTAISAMIFGVHNLFGLRLPAALIATVLVYFMYKCVVFLSNSKKLALYTSLILTTSFYIIFSGRNGQWDIFTHGFMVVSIYYQLLMIFKEERRWGHALLAGLFLGCSFLSKGPVSLYALWLPFVIAMIMVYRSSFKKAHILPFLTFLISGLIIGFSWFIYVRYADPEAFIEITKEETANWAGYNVRPFYYYWSFFTQSGIWTLPAFIGLLYPYLKKRVADPKIYRFSLIWTLASVILLSLIPEKKSRYLLPVLIPLAFNTASYIQYLIQNFSPNSNKWEKLSVYFTFLLIGLIGIIFPFGGYFFFADKLEGLWPYFILTSIALFAIGVLIIKYLRKDSIKEIFYLTIAFIISIMVLGFPIANAFNSNPGFHNIDDLDPEGLPLYSYGEQAPEMIWNLGYPAPEIEHNGVIEYPEDEAFGILVVPAKLNDFHRIFAKRYHIVPKDRYDINYTAAEGQKAWKDRLISEYFILKKK